MERTRHSLDCCCYNNRLVAKLMSNSYLRKDYKYDSLPRKIIIKVTYYYSRLLQFHRPANRTCVRKVFQFVVRTLIEGMKNSSAIPLFEFATKVLQFLWRETTEALVPCYVHIPLSIPFIQCAFLACRTTPVPVPINMNNRLFQPYSPIF